MFSSTRKRDRGLVSSSPPVIIVDAGYNITRQICMDGLCGHGKETQILGEVRIGKPVQYILWLSAVVWACCRINLMARMCSVLGALKWSVRADGETL